MSLVNPIVNSLLNSNKTKVLVSLIKFMRRGFGATLK